jgi:acid phosphatase
MRIAGSLLGSSTVVACLLSLSACDNTPAEPDPGKDLGLMWVERSAEYVANTRQVFQAATMALPGFIEDTSWSALLTQKNAGHLPPAVILDVDETVVSNVDFQLTYERPYANWKRDEWTRRTDATPVHGVKKFIDAARAQGVSVFFVTNRPCEPVAGTDEQCRQKQSTLDDIAEIGITSDASHVLLSEEQGWNREKSGRRDFIAQTHRVIMLIGDEVGDFLPCMRNKPVAPCTEPANNESRAAAVVEHSAYWGNGWYILPNPMHGAWTSTH